MQLVNCHGRITVLRAHGAWSMSSGRVPVELRTDSHRFQEKKPLEFDSYELGGFRERFRNENLNPLLTDAVVRGLIGLPCIGVDRHLRVTASPESADIVEGYGSRQSLEVVRRFRG